MASKTIESYHNGAEISKGDADCKKKSVELLKDLGLPKGLFPLENIEEFGYNQNAGFIWFIQKKKTEHTFKKIKQVVSYATEVYMEEASKEKVTFKTGTGLSDSFDASAFELFE
ncbi:hypothetical protein LUZ62_018533 [Rhynchospora pubera]|uniref:Uncharacterized protein n=1 Tax=Rhynchospora pubera TaxID=906938 RepID=A0AAV8GU32_9POAL|nr:hypothetical protein LUZ62_018533 [Rhynchospora pubera]